MLTTPVDITYRSILNLVVPLVLSSTGLMLMQFVDSLFLAWYDQEAMAASIPSAMAVFTLQSPFIGAAGFTSTLIAQAIGSRRESLVGTLVWQGIYFALLSGIALFFCGYCGAYIFALIDHAPNVQRLETIYFNILCQGAMPTLLASALSGFYSGRGDVKRLTILQLIGFCINALLDYLMIFGIGPFPEWGIAGAAWASVLAQTATAALLFAFMIKTDWRMRFETWSGRAFNAEYFRRLVRFGIPHGLRMGFEVFAWTAFLAFVGRTGIIELIASSIAFRINSLSFMPVMGLATAITILVGQMQGRKRPDLAELCVKRCLLLGQGWMLSCALIFLLFPNRLYWIFHDPQAHSTERFTEIAAWGPPLLRLMALYSLTDALNFTYLSALQGAGDTRWTLLVSIVLHALFLALLWWMDLQQFGALAFWWAAACFVLVQTIAWYLRYKAGHWRCIRMLPEEPAF